jgi:hypothetical protein
MSKVDLVVFYAHCDLWAKYVLGNEAYESQGWEPSSDPLASDCSGLVIGCFNRAKVLFGGKTLSQLTGWTRPNANRLYQVAKPIAQPTLAGDLFFRVNSEGRAYHVGIYVGHGHTIESGDGTGKTGKHTVTWQNARGVVWGRFPGADLGTVTPPGQTLPAVDWPDMYLFSFGRYVRELKTILNYLQGSGLTLSDTATGQTFGPVTLREAKRFQAGHLRPSGEVFAKTGRVGPDTKAAMLRAILDS